MRNYSIRVLVVSVWTMIGIGAGMHGQCAQDHRENEKAESFLRILALRARER